jgi:hypothetical protein
LSDAERTVFVDLVTTCDPTHFQPSDLPLLCRYCEAAVLAEQAALELRRGAVVDGKPSPWITIQEKAVKGYGVAFDAAAPVAAEQDRPQDTGAEAGLYRANAVGIERRLKEGVS